MFTLCLLRFYSSLTDSMILSRTFLFKIEMSGKPYPVPFLEKEALFDVTEAMASQAAGCNFQVNLLV